MDRNLEDDWLEHLNALEAFVLISICEGHYDGQSEPSGTPPHIKLRLTDTLLPGVARHWDEHKMAILDAISRLFQTGDTYVNLELKFKLRSGTGRLNYQENLIIRIHGRQARDSEKMDTRTHDWFSQSVKRIEELDSLVVHLWGKASQSAQ